MPIQVTCSCGLVLQARDEDAGKEAKCPKCGQAVAIPSPLTRSAPSPQMHQCRVCGFSFGPNDVYTDRGGVICKRCYKQAEEPPPAPARFDTYRDEPRDRDDWDEPDLRRRRPIIATHLAEAILCTLFCCLPFGIVAIVKASQVSGLQAGGNYQEARAASAAAATWCWLSFGIGLAVSLVWGIIWVAALSKVR